MLLMRSKQQEAAGPYDGVRHQVSSALQVQHHCQGVESHLPKHGLQMSISVEAKDEEHGS